MFIFVLYILILIVFLDNNEKWVLILKNSLIVLLLIGWIVNKL